MECGRINFKACRLCPNGTYPDESLKESVPNRLTASCVRSCIAHLETTERITKRYKTPFRVREQWKLGIFDV